jgi:hypothetical protein
MASCCRRYRARRLKAFAHDPQLLVIRPAPPPTSLDHLKPFKLSTALMAVHKDCYAPIGRRTLLDDRHACRSAFASQLVLVTVTFCYYGVAINPLSVATIQRLPQRTIESIRPIPGTVSPRVAIRTPSGPSRTAVPPRTSRTVQPSIVVGLVSGAGTIGPRSVRVLFAWIA